MRTFSKVALLLTALSILVLFSACTKASEDPLKIATNLWVGNEPLYLAAKLNFLKPAKYKFIEYASATEVIRAFRSKSVDMAVLTMDEVAQLIQDGVDPKLILVLDESFGADALIASSKVKNISQLKGKRIGVEQTALGKFFLSLFLEKYKLQESDFQIVNLEVSKHLAAFKNKQVDAVITFEPFLDEIKKMGGQVLFDSKSTPGQIIDVLVVRPEVFNTHKDEIKEIIQVWGKTLSYISENKEESIQLMSERMNISVSDFKSALAKINLIDLDKNIELLDGSQTIRNLFRKLAQQLKHPSTPLGLQDEADKFESFHPVPLDWYKINRGK